MSLDRWLAIIALVIACIGGVPGFLEIIKNFRPISLNGSIKFYARTTSNSIPKIDEFLVALTLVNEGSKDMVWRKLTASLLLDGKTVHLEPILISKEFKLGDEEIYKKDIFNFQVLAPGQPFNGYMNFNASDGSLGTGNISPLKLNLQFEVESGRSYKIELPFINIHPIKEGEAYPMHGIQF